MGLTCASMLMWTSEDNMQEAVLSVHSVGPGDQTQVLRLGGTIGEAFAE